jgi:hypothetical protein
MAKFNIKWLYNFFSNSAKLGKPFNPIQKMKLMIYVHENRIDEMMDLIKKMRPAKKHKHSIKIDTNFLDTFEKGAVKE